MAYIDVQTSITSILNRRDLTPSQLVTFLNFGAQRIGRTIRCPAQEITVSHTFDGTETYPGRLLVPGDMLEIIDIFLNDSANQRKLVKKDRQTVLVAAQTVGAPSYYFREGATFILGPTPPVAQLVFMSYYQDAVGLVNPADVNWLTDAAPDLWVYAALTYASDFFMDERADTWEQTYQQIAGDIMNMSNDDELQNASISQTYNTDPLDYYPYE